MNQIGRRGFLQKWVFHSLEAGQSPAPSIELLGKMGFDGVELIVSAPQDLTGLISIEQDGHPGDMNATCKRYLELMRSPINA